MNKRLRLSLLLPLLIVAPLRGQTLTPLPLHLERISNDLGLSQNLITCILQDRQGFLWFGTPDGLNKFDGYKFTVYRHEAYDSTSLSDNHVQALCEDREGRIWVGTQSGLNLFDRTTEAFDRSLARENPSNPKSLSRATIMDIRENPHDEGAIWIATLDGLERLMLPAGANNLSEAAYSHFHLDPDNSNRLDRNQVARLAVDGRGAVWASTDSAIYKISRLAAGAYQSHRVALDPPDPDWKRALDGPSQRYLLAPGKNGAVWLGTGFGLARWDAAQGAFTYFKLPLERTPGFQWEAALTMYEEWAAPQSRLWIGTWKGVARFDFSANSFSFHQHEPGNPNSAPESGIGAFLQDEAGVMWLGSNGNGLFRQDAQARRFAQRGTDNRLSVWRGTSLRALCETDSPAALWLGTANDKLYRMNRRSGEMSLVPPPREFPNWGVVVAMLQDKRGALWIGNHHGLFRMEWKDGRAGAFSYFKPEPDLPGMPLHEVKDIFEDRDGEIWIATRAHLLRFDRATNGFVPYRYASNDLAAIKQNTYTFIHQDRRGRFWLGTAAGLLRFDPRTRAEDGEAFQRYFHDAKNPASLSHNLVRAICEDPDDPENILWIGTAGGGLNRFDMRTENFTHFTTKDGLPNMVIYAILHDNDGNLWMSTNHGLSRFTPRTLAFRNFDAGDGLQDNEFNAASFFKSASGELFFGGINGFNAFYPANIRDNPHVPPVVFTDFQLFNRPVSFKEKKSLLRAPINETKELALAHDQNVFSFEFAALDYTDPAKNRYRYMMENFDKAWRENGTSRTATYTNLNPGTYVFRVQGSNNDGVWNEKGASIKITITPPWWQTWWAYTLYVLTFAAILYGLRRYEMNRQQLKHQVEVERLQAEKKNLETARLTELDRLKSRFFANISHEFRTPLTLILGPVEQILGEVIEERARPKLRLVQNNAQRLLGLINQLLDLSKLESGKMQLRAAEGDLVAFLQNLAVSFAPLAERKRIALRFEAKEKKLLVYFDRDKAEKIFSNLLSNAIKFTPEGGSVTVEMGKAGDGESGRVGEREIHPVTPSPTLQVTLSPSLPLAFAFVTIKDTGIGIPAEKLPHVFDRFYQVDASPTRAYEGTGIGLALVKELVELHRGTVSVISAEGQGSTFTVALPLGKDHLAPEEVLEVAEQYSVSSDREAKIEDSGLKIVDEATIGQQQATSDQHPASSHEHPATSNEQPDLILLVEDHAEMRRFVRQELEPAYRVHEAGDGEAGWEKALEAIPDLMISDVMMPKMNGYELCRRLKTDERTSHIPVILLTAKADQPDKLAGLETGADDYLSKPFDRQELVARVKNLIALRRKLRERFARQLTLKPSEVTVESRDEAFLQRALAVMEEQISNEEFSVEDFQRAVGMSKTQLHRKLKALVNQAPREFMRTFRLQRAAQLLKQGAGNVTEIAYMVGFSSQPYFTKCFQEEFGVTPKEYAKREEQKAKGSQASS